MDYVDPILELATENRQLKAERDSLAADNTKLRNALENIIKHQEAVAGKSAPLTSIWWMANEALKSTTTE